MNYSTIKPTSTVCILKKDGTKQSWDSDRIVSAIRKSADNIMYELDEEQIERVLMKIAKLVDELGVFEVPFQKLHLIVMKALDSVVPEVATSYRQYRNYKMQWQQIMQNVVTRANSIMFRGDKENANADSKLVSTKRTLIFNELNKQLYSQYFLTEEERLAIKAGFIYVNDMSARRDTMNCCIFDIANVLRGGFEMGNIWYNEPNSLDVAFDVIGDVVLSAASQQYGGFTIPEVDSILEPYAHKSFEKKCEHYRVRCHMSEEEAKKLSLEDLKIEFEQGFQGWEYKFNTVASSRGDYPFITMTLGLATSAFGKMAAVSALEVRQKGQGKKGFKKPVLFPKIVFLYDEQLHQVGCSNEDVFEAGIACNAKTMYPDWLSLTGEGYVPSIYKQYRKAISPMGCRAFLSPWYEKGGLYPADETDEPVFVGRFNIGVVSLHLPLIYANSKANGKSFQDNLGYYLEMIRKIHLRTYDYLSQMKASTNPLAYCEGGFYGGTLKENDKIAPLLKYATASFGVTALQELQMLHNGKSLVEDGMFALETMNYINRRVNDFKSEDEKLYAIYGTPAESLCGSQIIQFRELFGIISGVSDREYVSNSFHCHVTEKIEPTVKQDLENRFWDLFNGGKIQYVKYPVAYNDEAIRTLVRRAMDMGFYEGVNLSLSYCDDCGHQELNMDTCPKCGSTNLTKIDRMNGYLSYSRVKGSTRLNDAKMAEILERKSM